MGCAVNLLRGKSFSYQMWAGCGTDGWVVAHSLTSSINFLTMAFN
jgi:hypothetical protein